MTHYAPLVNSPVTYLAASINNTVTTVPVIDASKLPAAPNLATIGTGENAETILYTGRSGNNLTGVTRGFQGTASSWNQGIPIARQLTAHDISQLQTDTAVANTAINAATSAATANTIIRRDANARAQIATPAVAADISTRGYVDTAIAAIPPAQAAVLIAIIEDQKAQNTQGGSFDSGADRTRVLNTLVYNRGSVVSLATNQFTITPTGTQEFLIKWSAPAHFVDTHQSLLHRISPSAGEVKRGTSVHVDNVNTIVVPSNGSVVVSLSVATVYEIRHRCNTTRVNEGFGVAANFGTEVYTQVEIYRLI